MRRVRILVVDDDQRLQMIYNRTGTIIAIAVLAVSPVLLGDCRERGAEVHYDRIAGLGSRSQVDRDDVRVVAVPLYDRQRLRQQLRLAAHRRWT